MNGPEAEEPIALHIADATLARSSLYKEGLPVQTPQEIQAPSCRPVPTISEANAASRLKRLGSIAMVFNKTSIHYIFVISNLK